jgi:hypothetical protein
MHDTRGTLAWLCNMRGGCERHNQDWRLAAVEIVALQYFVDFRIREEVAGWGTGWEGGTVTLVS